MASCEKCWVDAFNRSYNDPMKDQAECYSELIKERKDNPCTPEQQAGTDAKKCPKCKRMTIHQMVGSCTNCK